MQQAPISSSTPPTNGPISHQQQISGQQNYTLSKTDETERLRQRLQGLREHHNESVNIYEQTQPIIDKQIHEDTVKYLKNGPVNGNTKSQKPKRRPKNAAAVATTATTTTITDDGGNQSNYQIQANLAQTSHYGQQHNQTQAYEYQQTNESYQQMPATHQPQPHHQYQPLHHQQMYTHQHQQNPHRMQQPVLQTIDQPSHFINQQHYNQQINHNQNYYNHQPQLIRPSNNFIVNTLPTDLDLNLQAGLECDVDFLINHEMSVEGQLDFNHDLLHKLDNYNPPH